MDYYIQLRVGVKLRAHVHLRFKHAHHETKDWLLGLWSRDRVPISSKRSFICTITLYIPRPLLHRLWSAGWNEKYLNVSTMRDQSNDPSHHERTLVGFVVKEHQIMLMNIGFALHHIFGMSPGFCTVVRMAFISC